MNYRLLGNSGLRVSELCLGTMTFGQETGWGASQDECRQMFEAFMEAGGNFVDTADFYTGGTSERRSLSGRQEPGSGRRTSSASASGSAMSSCS